MTEVKDLICWKKLIGKNCNIFFYFKLFNMLVKSKQFLLYNMKRQTIIFDVFCKIGRTNALMVAKMFQK